MTFVDSCDSIFMLWAYAAPQRSLAHRQDGDDQPRAWHRRLRLFELRHPASPSHHPDEKVDEKKSEAETETELENERRADKLPVPNQDRLLRVSVVLTVISIVIALLISTVRMVWSAVITIADELDAAQTQFMGYAD